MSKHVEKFKKQLLEIADVVNSFKSEAVQVKIVDRFLDAMLEWEKANGEPADNPFKRFRTSESASPEETTIPKAAKKPGATKILNQLLSTDYFKSARSIASIANFCKEKFNLDFKTSELSGVLLKLANENKLRRERNHENNRFEYVQVS